MADCRLMSSRHLDVLKLGSLDVSGKAEKKNTIKIDSIWEALDTRFVSNYVSKTKEHSSTKRHSILTRFVYTSFDFLDFKSETRFIDTDTRFFHFSKETRVHDSLETRVL